MEAYTLVRPPILPSKQMWRFIRWSAHQYKAWDIGGFCKSATGGTDHAGPTWGFIDGYDHASPTWGLIGGSDHAGPTWGFIGGSDCLLWRSTQLYLGGVRGGEGWARKKEALLPSKQFWRFIHWSDHQYKAWNIGGFANRPPVGPTTPVRRRSLLVGPTVYCESLPNFFWKESGERGVSEPKNGGTIIKKTWKMAHFTVFLWLLFPVWKRQHAVKAVDRYRRDTHCVIKIVATKSVLLVRIALKEAKIGKFDSVFWMILSLVDWNRYI